MSAEWQSCPRCQKVWADYKDPRVTLVYHIDVETAQKMMAEWHMSGHIDLNKAARL